MNYKLELSNKARNAREYFELRSHILLDFFISFFNAKNIAIDVT